MDRNRVQAFRDSLQRATTFDSWGQVVEAGDEYAKLVKDIAKAIENEEADFKEHQVKFLSMLTRAVQLRAKASLDLSGEIGIRLEQVQKLIPLLEKLPDQVPAQFPIEVKGLRQDIDSMLPVFKQKQEKKKQAIQKQESRFKQKKESQAKKLEKEKEKAPPEEEEEEEDVVKPEQKPGGTLSIRKRFPGNTGITIRILYITLQDANTYIEPFFTVSIHDKDGSAIKGGEAQDTPPTNEHQDMNLIFNQDVHMQIPLEAMPKDAAIFFEFKHYKPRKQKVSTKCFAFLEMDELKNGKTPMELYQKPTDFRRKKVYALTDKPHYLYVLITRHNE
eukprot:m.46739 g.46739  ORF g.46739 m.46739 type:complete len:332 (-) comp10401_c0_seq1:3810-4805(-)